MRSFLALILTMVAGIALLSFPASAALNSFDGSELEVSCSGYEIRVWGTAEAGIEFYYRLKLHTFTGEWLRTIDGSEGPLDPTFDLTVSGDWGMDMNGAYRIAGRIELRPLGGGDPVAVGCLGSDVPLECPPPGTGTPGYWKNHPDAWPVDEIWIGGVKYLKDDAIAFMKERKKGDKTFTMFAALVCARLNVLAGNDDSCIADTIVDADGWMSANGPVGSGVKAGGKSSPWRDGEPLYEMLDDYNNGLLDCASHRAGKLAAPPVEEATWGQVKNLSE